MKLFLFSLLFPLFSMAQEPQPKFENDTLYTASGYKIFKGSVIEFNHGTERYGRFKYVSPKNGILSTSLIGNTVTIDSFKKYWVSALNNGYIIFDGRLKRQNGTIEYIVLQMAFDRAIENSPVIPSEIKVPDEFRNKYRRDLEREKLFLYNMYKDKVIKQVVYQDMKKKLDAE
jgi:hypothetical protein